jgi:TPR repeat protein
MSAICNDHSAFRTRLRTAIARLLSPASNRGVAWAQKAYERGDYADALRELRTLVMHGDARAQTLLGRMYNGGEGVPQDYAESARLYALAAEAGDAVAQYNLGIMTGDGDGVAQDDIRSLMWLSLAQAQGSALAAEEVESAVLHMPADEVEEARDLALEWKQRHDNKRRWRHAATAVDVRRTFARLLGTVRVQPSRGQR